MSQHIVIVDDEEAIRKRLAQYLKKEGYRTTAAADGTELRALVDSDSIDLVILDLMMPGEDGLSLTRYLREQTEVGILILTGKGDAVDRVVGLEMGADDYLAKPFDLRELLARVRSILRRAAPKPDASAASPAAEPSNTYRFGRWSLDTDRMELSEDGAAHHLTTAEYKLLAALVENAGRPLNRDRLLDVLSGRDWSPYDRSIDIHISNLRKKIEDNPKKPAFIKTVRGAGYVFAGLA